MSVIIQELNLEDTIKLACMWVNQQQEYIDNFGAKLTPHQIALAIQVGVRQPELIRILTIEKIPSPNDETLSKLAEKLNFLGPGTLGITLGYCIYVRDGYVDDRLLSHEFRHVYQFEESGSIQVFIGEYLQQLIQYGYELSPFEIDAREHEVSN
jgi:hypothetical protein